MVDLNSFSLLALWSATALYALALIAFALDLGRRSAEVNDASHAVSSAVAASEARSEVTAEAGGGVAVKTRPAAKKRDDSAPQVTAKRSPSLRSAMALMVLGFLLHVAADVTRGIAAERVPWANLYEFVMTGTMLVVAVFLVVNIKVDLRYLGTFISLLVVSLLCMGTINFYVEVAPLPPALQSAWLVIHVFLATTAMGFLALGCALSVLQLIQARTEARGAAIGDLKLKFMATFPTAHRLENLAYRTVIVGFVLWTFTLIAGSIWAEAAWGRYWGWDTKEVWTFIIWVIYAGYIHARATKGWRGSRAAWLAIIGFGTVIFNFTVVNIFFNGLHSYSGL
ncbi:c-type cytochrome biogenesis protein CcsB [Microbacterium sp. MPKO10]|uniref:c-type cytochrome biogenesis protein CcsB n=1 Tax=Microbacterium sp. MPKO10 TaxID=2989818 RepID=UPI002235F49C|nr:c-type cytochrome biogenesis protein CcsB [Microbacterium sp. MPKO10]MCW4456953.1 c-type cytochrome biogenesis protein CcsB [Microbacterium sp. MPKO10]